MAETDLLTIFEKTGALLKGHFELSSGKHSDQYFQCALVLQNPKICESVAAQLAEKFKDEKIDYVIGPALGGVIIAYELARQLGCRSIFTERKEGEMQLRRGFSLNASDRVLLVEDVVTTGGSILEVADLMEKMEVSIAGIACIVNRSNQVSLGKYSLVDLVQMKPNIYDPKDCPLCKAGIPIDKPGSKQKNQ